MLLVLDDDGVAYDGGREAALGTYGELLQKVVSGGFPDAGFELFGGLAVGGLRGDEAEYDGFSSGTWWRGSKVPERSSSYSRSRRSAPMPPKIPRASIS
jgi:hypothetical protein